MTQTEETADAAGRRPPSGLPLEGTRVLDLTMVWAGPFATKHLADLGADVVKVEGPGRTDLVRSLTIPDESVDRPWDTSRYFHEYNRGKLGMAVDVRQEEGKQILLELAASSDVLIENFRPGVIDRLGLAWDVLHEVNPRLIVVSVPGYSAFEPERSIPGYGPNVEQMGGLAHFNGYTGGPPQKSGISYGDPMAGLGGVAAVLLALVQRERTGLGQRIEVGQRNILVGLVGDALVGHQLGVPYQREGNRSGLAAPQGVYATQGRHGQPAEEADSWLAVSVRTAEQWRALTEVLARPDLADRTELHELAHRKGLEDELDEALASWARTRTARAAADELQAAGIPASPVLGPTDLVEDPQLRSRGFFVEVEHPILGTTTLTRPTWRFADEEPVLTPAPGLGEHNEYVLREFLDYPPDRIADLAARGVIADRPAGL